GISAAWSYPVRNTNGTPCACSASAIGNDITPARLTSRMAPSSGTERARSIAPGRRGAGPTTSQPHSRRTAATASATRKETSTTRTRRPASAAPSPAFMPGALMRGAGREVCVGSQRESKAAAHAILPEVQLDGAVHLVLDETLDELGTEPLPRG